MVYEYLAKLKLDLLKLLKNTQLLSGDMYCFRLVAVKTG